MTTKTRKRRRKPKLGDVFALPLEDGSYGVAQVGTIAYDVPTYVIFDAHLQSVDDVARELDGVLRRPVATAIVLTGEDATEGRWPLVASRPPVFAFAVPAFSFEAGSTSYSDDIVLSLANTYAGTATRPMHPDFLRQFVVPGAPPPPAPRPRDGGLPARSQEAELATPAPRSTSPPNGPARAIVTIPYAGGELPSVELVRRRQRLGAAIEERGLGAVTDAGGGGGVLEIEAEVADAAAVHPRLLDLLREHGFRDATVVYR